ncbi:MAG: hypothetical protein C6I01_04635 [Epsilonproteobacteria bacterium]|nr:hypothetical protein [Campylobacterota bacterium]NPA89479.1 hypothetical protein [Campylobacterota bacterium]
MKKIGVYLIGVLGIVGAIPLNRPSPSNPAFLKATAITHAKFGNGKDASGHTIYKYINRVEVATDADQIKVGATTLRGKRWRNKQVEAVAVVDRVKVEGRKVQPIRVMEKYRKKRKVLKIGETTLTPKSRVRRVVTYIRDVEVKRK